MGTHCETGELQPVDIIKRSGKKEEQYWERQLLPADFEKRVKKEKALQETDELYADAELDEIRLREWHRRLYGVWFWNNGATVYLTGLHYFFINYWKLATGYPDFRIIDWEKAVMWQCVVEDPNAIGMIEVRKRRDGKSFFAGCMMYEALSRTHEGIEGGIVSYSKESGAEFFSKTIVSPFKHLPSFFIPVWDTSSTLKAELRFIQPSVKGRKNSLLQANNNGEELGSYLTFMDSKLKAYDGHQLKRGVVDEVFKTDVDCFSRHLVIKYCAISHTGEIVGKILYTSTVEEIGVKYRGDTFFAENDQLRRLPVPDSVERSGELYCFFMPAFRSGKYDKYGYCNEAKEKIRILAAQNHLKNNEKDLIADMRKNPFDVVQAFRITSNKCHFNQSILYNRIDEIGWTDVVTRGDLVWEDAVVLSKVIFVPNKSGRFYICTGFKFDDEKDGNNVIKRGNSYEPGNTSKFVLGIDPYDHDLTEDGRKSDAAFYVRKKYNPVNLDDPYSKAFVMEYIYRPATAPLMYDDVLKACFYFGCPMLFESQKQGIKRHFQNLGCSSFLIHLDGYKEPGIPSTPENKQVGVDIIEEEINQNIQKVYFKRLLKSWADFDVNNTQKFDAAMGSMWTLYADKYKTVKRDPGKLRPITDYVKKYKIKTA